MAKRRTSKLAPSVMRLWFRINASSTRNYVDLSLACSAANRRFYRQGTTWAVAGMALHTTTSGSRAPSGTFDVSKIPDTWVAANAHTKAKSLWMESQNQVIDNAESIAAKYRDFKIYLDSDMVGASISDTNDAATTGQIMLPIDSGNFTTKFGEWVYSTIQFPNAGGSSAPIEGTLHMVGDDSGSSLGIIKGYGLSRSRPTDVEPNVPTAGGWMNDVMDVADNLDEIRDDVHNNNDEPPYRVGIPTEANEYYPGGENNTPSAALHSKNFVTDSTVGGKTMIQGGSFPCGLIRFDWNIADQDDMYLSIDLVPGNYKGYLTEVY